MATTPSLAAQPESFLQWQLVYFRSGTRKSPVMQPLAEGLSDGDIRELSAYFAALPPASKDSAAPADAAMYAVGEKLAQQHRCASCHRDDYAGANAAARTANQREDYLLKALRDFKAGARTGGGVAAMADVVYPLGDEQLQALARYMAHFTTQAR
jgi:cytochrome c553